VPTPWLGYRSRLAANRLLVASLAQLGRLEEAREARALLAVALPGYTLAAAATHLALRDAPLREPYLNGLREADLAD
jgi:hypothetical protein